MSTDRALGAPLLQAQLHPLHPRPVTDELLVPRAARGDQERSSPALGVGERLPAASEILLDAPRLAAGATSGDRVPKEDGGRHRLIVDAVFNRPLPSLDDGAHRWRAVSTMADATPPLGETKKERVLQEPLLTPERVLPV